MKPIQWYPGHMAKAMRMMGENLKLCDAVVFVLDARAPASTYNARLTQMAAGKNVLFVLNKGDLADGNAEMLLKKMQLAGKNTLKIAANSPLSVRPLRAAMEKLAFERAERNRAKGVIKPLRFLVAGIPNTGKSTLINLLAGGKKAQTGDKAGVTRAKQWVKCGAFELLDTPGAMPPSCDDQRLARRLAYLGCINDDILALDEIALCLLEELFQKYPEALRSRYGIEGGEPLEMLQTLCKKRGFFLKGEEFDFERGERALLDDLRKGKLGAVCLDGEDDLKAVNLI